MKRAWNYLVAEPFSVLFNCLFHPFELNSVVEIQQPSQRIGPMFRLALPMFIFSFLLALFVRVLLFLFFPSNGFGFLLFIALAIALATVGGIGSGIAGGIKLGIWSGIGSSIIMGILGGLMASTGGLTVGLVGLSLALGIGLSNPEGRRESDKKRRTTIIIGSGFLLIIFYISLSLILVFLGGLGEGALGGFLESRGIAAKNGIIFGCIIGFVGGSIMLGVFRGISWGSRLGYKQSTSWSATRYKTGNYLGKIASVVGQIVGIPLGFIIWSLVGSILGAILGGLIDFFLWFSLGNNIKTIGAEIQKTYDVYIPGSTTTAIGLGFLVGTFLIILLALSQDIILVTNFIKKGRKYIRESDAELLRKIDTNIEQAEAIGQSTFIGIIGGILGGILTYIASNLSIGIGVVSGLMIATALFTSYYLGYFQPLPLLSRLSELSLNWAYRVSSKKPDIVLNYLRGFPLHWNKSLPLDTVKLVKLLSIAIQQDTKQALLEINFILTQRPELLSAKDLTNLLRITAKQDTEQALLEINFILTEKQKYAGAVQRVWLEITTRKLEMCENLHDIAEISQEFSETLQDESALIPHSWVTTLALLDYASREAAHYCSPLPLSWRTRREALKEMIAYLKRADTSTPVVPKWREIAQMELEELEKVAINWIDNPYTAGPALELRNSLFVGRRDLVRQLEDALGRGRRRPTFFLNGERRMGKSSTLKQLPDMLAAHYLSIFYDLQVRGISSSIAAFLGTIASEIYEMTASRAIQIKKLEEERLQEAAGKNEATVYYVFDEWLKDVEHKLEQENRTLLLTFDEFEKLGEAGQSSYLDLKLLLDWFRSVVQNHPRLALLFSGVSNLEEMSLGTGINWAGYFVNVRRLKVSFLKPEEAFKLITEPVPNFPGEEIFGAEVIEEIMRVTGCHPFLVQAVCETLIDNLNADKRDRAEMQDVTAAVNQVLANWWDTYFRDLWARTDQNQRICLITMKRLGAGDLEGISQQSKLGERIVRDTLQVLVERDLLLFENEHYRISTPIFTEWVKRNS